jgi:hypothetical protein
VISVIETLFGLGLMALTCAAVLYVAKRRALVKPLALLGALLLTLAVGLESYVRYVGTP